MKTFRHSKKLAVALMVSVAACAVAEMGDVRLKRYLGDRLDAMILRHVVGTDVDYITAPFLEKTERRNWWQSEFWGKYMHSAVPYLQYLANGVQGTGKESSLKNSIERGIERMLASQEPNGYIGNYPDELRCGEGWDVWGMKYTMMGLLHYYDGECESVKCKTENVKCELDRASRALDASKRLCDYVIAELGPNGRRGR